MQFSIAGLSGKVRLVSKISQIRIPIGSDVGFIPLSVCAPKASKSSSQPLSECGFSSAADKVRHIVTAYPRSHSILERQLQDDKRAIKIQQGIHPRAESERVSVM
jgi:hypothetical protein